MKFFSIVASMLIVSSTFATDLIQSAKDFGLEPLPQSQKEIDDALKNIGIKSGKFTKEKAELGKKLYFEPRLSKSGIISCNTCHNLGLGGTDGVSAAVGHGWKENPHHLNSPTVYNSIFNTTQFWDGRSSTLADQAKGPIENPVEMATPANLAVEKIASLPQYVDEFKKIYGKEGVTFDNIADSIAMFERTLITPSRYDKFLRGDKKALSKAEQDGLKLFIDKGCATCHNGINLGGSMQTFDLAKKYKFANLGDFKGDVNGMVKTPTLRNITLTAPYFHNGAIWSIEEAIKTMGSLQLGIEITDEETKSIKTFLESLTGEMPQVTYPMFPASTQKTPQPDFSF
ncbi:cytochrome c551 peroxidase [Campylobacter sputorum subsp. bubulus]|uniref:Cytochrome c551 peroxidase n=1 Tax=Campylobacter sputorum subsp. sputorum TaxID=32024 RepID=A0A381DKP4_9BACT|nr:cytochrome-c peroxidase [Campylobacter sputorum]ASM34546.1 periplasmic diheme cytochrome c peroxidase [Campylobacter sputorum aubsp. sputorum RM3237]ASM37896.1 periplasmic diheme cytochrome c peroxidase [Campylobacter sputorum bv. paraureolyticus LMG 11764]KAB0580769.1 cytochrome-c peroxidase [Campylobacter sputorum subsp. sputorum]MDY6120999.1 cytochrome-c peroxidase [Campylobacter sputorum]QEL04736.1 periplasmic diheme cytochrome c peroxidase [Campylobacter sputorum subsp. sputorum]